MLTLKQLGKKLKEIRQKIGFSQEFVAEELGISRQAIIAIEAGTRKIDSFELFKLAGIYNVHIEDLLEERKPVASNFQEAIMSLRNKGILSNEEKKGLLEFQKICEDYEFLKSL